MLLFCETRILCLKSNVQILSSGIGNARVVLRVREYTMKQQCVLAYVLLSLWVAEHGLSQEQYL